MEFHLRDTWELNREAIIELYRANKWSSAEKPDKLMAALRGSHSLISAWQDSRLVGLGNAISDGALVVYYPHLLVHPDYRGRGVGRMIMNRLGEKYGDFHQQVLVADGATPEFYRKCGFENAGETRAMWIYQGNDH